MLKEGKMYVPKDGALRVEIIRLHHDTPYGRTWGTMENGGNGNQKFLVARRDKGGKEIHRRV